MSWSRALATTTLVVLAIAGARAVRAQPAPTSRGPVAILPFAADKRLALYGQPVAFELARALREAGLDVTLVSSGAPVPTHARLVVDGRIVRVGAGALIETRIRDPQRGVDVGRTSASAAALDDLPRAAAVVAAELGSALTAGLAAQDAAAARERAAVAVPPTRAAPDPVRPRAPARDRRPLALVAVRSADLVGGSGERVVVAPLAAPAVVDLVARVGRRATVVEADAALAPVMLADRGAELGVLVEMLAFTTRASRDIPLGWARARVTVVDTRGQPVFQRIVRTDTLVGSRGDRVDTLVRFAAAQITDVVAPRLRERLAGQP